MTTAPAQPVVPKKAMDAGAVGFTPGVYPGMTDPDYRCAPGVSQSMLKTWASGKETPRTRALLVGTALHARFLGGREEFERDFQVLDQQYNLRKPEGKQAVEEVRKTGKTAINVGEFEMVVSMFKALTADPTGKQVYEAKADRELSIFAKIPGYDTLCKGRIDLARKAIWDVKTTNYRDESEFRNAIVDYGYDAQGALYREIYAATHGFIYLPVRWLCVSKQEPYNVWAMECDPERLACGLRWVNTVLGLYERYSDADQRTD